MPDPSSLSVTVLITTKDRKQVVVRAIESVLRQTVPVELLVVDDGSRDGTAELVAKQFPQARLIRHPEPLGIIAARNAAAQMAQGEILFTLDDDAEFRTPDLVESVLRDFSHPRVGVVLIPYDNHHPDGRIDPFPALPGRDNEDFLCTFPYPGGSNAMRRKLFLALGGYSGADRQSEEPSFAIRLLDHGYVTRASSTATIDHYPEYSDRDHGTIIYAGARNGIRFLWKFVPWRYLPQAIAASSVSRLLAARRRGHVIDAIRGVVRGMGEGIGELALRRAVSPQAYRLSKRLAHQPTRWSEVEPLLGPQRPLPQD